MCYSKQVSPAGDLVKAPTTREYFYTCYTRIPVFKGRSILPISYHIPGLSVYTIQQRQPHPQPPSETRPPNIDSSFRKQYLQKDTLPLTTPHTSPSAQVFLLRPNAVGIGAYSQFGSFCRRFNAMVTTRLWSGVLAHSLLLMTSVSIRL